MFCRKLKVVKVDQLTKQLFPNFPREIAFPWRVPVRTMNSFKMEIQRRNGIDDIYTSVYGSNYMINKLFFDLDWGDFVTEDAKAIFKFVIDSGWQCIPIVSGKKGYHLYIPLYPQIHKEKAKIRLLRAHYSILKSVFGNFKQQMITLPRGKTVNVFRIKDRIIAPDPMICGDVKRIARVPNTLRPPENINYCTYLPPDRFLDMTEEDIVLHMKEPHTYYTKIDYRKAPKLTDFKFEFEQEPNFSSWTPVDTPHPIRTGNPNMYLKAFLRPCVYRHLTSIHPSDNIRFCATVDLCMLGLETDEIISYYSSLGWEDFDEHFTRKKVIGIRNGVKSGKHHQWSCGKLISLGVPRKCCIE